MPFVQIPLSDAAQLYAHQKELALLKDLWCVYLQHGAFDRADATKLAMDQLSEDLIAYDDQHEKGLI